MLCTPFHVTIHRDPEKAGTGPLMFARSFEQVVEMLAALPRLFVEPDGAFVWVASSEPDWQVDGVLYDGGAGLWYMEVKGRCPQARFDELLRPLGWPETPVIYQLVREAVTLGEEEFRRHVGWSR